MSQVDETPNAAGALSIPFRFARLKSLGERLSHVFSEEERAKMQVLYDLVSFSEGSVKLELKNVKGGVRMTGQINAKLAQSCGLTGQPVPLNMDQTFELTFIKTPKHVVDSELEVEPLGEDEELYPGDEGDLGPIVEEYFVLGLNPYPRSDAAFFEHIEDDGVETGAFAALKALKPKKN